MITEFSTFTGISVEDILGSSRNADICDARHVYWYRLLLMGYSYPMVARLCDREHSTIYSGVRRIGRMKDSDPRIRYMLEQTKHIKRNG